MTPLYLKDRIRSALIRRLGGVPYDEYASVDHRRQDAEHQRDQLDTALRLLDSQERIVPAPAGLERAHRVVSNDGLGL